MSVNPPVDNRVAVCVCTYGRGKALSRLLESMEDIDLTGYNPDAVELIVVDAMPVQTGASIPYAQS